MKMDRRTWLKGSAALVGAFALQAPVRAAAHPRGAAIAAIRQLMEAHREALGVPGLTLCLVDGDGVDVLTSGFADVERGTPVRPDHLFQIGSISKSFVGLAILRAVEAGKLTLDSDPREILPDLRLPDGVRITLRHLLNHSSGLPDNTGVFGPGEAALWLGYVPGSQWSYSNLGYDILGSILEAVEGKPLSTIHEEGVFRALGMTASRGDIQSPDRPLYATGYGPLLRDRPYPRKGPLATGAWIDTTSGAGSIASTPGDMAKYVRWLIDAGKGKGAPLMTDASATAFTTKAQDAPDWGEGAKYALGLAIVQEGGRRYLHHTGGMVTFSSSLHVDPAAGVGCFASSNVGFTDYRPSAITLYACQALKAVREGNPLPPLPDAVTPFDGREALAGVFRDADGSAIALRVEGKRLVAAFGGREAEVEAAGENGILIPIAGLDLFPVAVVRDGKRAVSLWHGGRQFAKDPAVLDRATPPAALSRLAGRFDNDNPWEGVIRIAARPDGLYYWGTDKLTPMMDGSYRYGEHDWTPERIRFEDPLKGVPQRLSLSGTAYLRRDD